MVWEEAIFLLSLFRPSPQKNPGVCTLHTFETKMAAHNGKHLISTILQKTREMWTVYTNIFAFSYLWSCRSSLGARCFWFWKLMKEIINSLLLLKNKLDNLHWKSWQTNSILVRKFFSFQHSEQNGLRLENYHTCIPCYMTEADGTKLVREDKHHVYVKRQTRICATWPSFPISCCLLFIISTPTLVVSNNFSSIRIVLSCFYLLIFYFEKFSTWIWYMLFAIYVKLKRYSTVKILQDSKPVTMELYHR